MDLLSNYCGVPAEKQELYELCLQYKIPFNKEEFDNNKTQLWLVSRNGVTTIDRLSLLKQKCEGRAIFNSIESLRQYLFKYALFNHKVLIHKDSYKAYTTLIEKLSLLGISGIKRKSYYQEAKAFYLLNDNLTSVTNEFSMKCLVSIVGASSYQMDEFISLLKEVIKTDSGY